MATAFVKAGASVAITGRNQGTLDEANESLQRIADARTLAISADGSNEEAIRDAVHRVLREFDRIDVLVNCAQSFGAQAPLEEHSLEDFYLSYSSGVFATFLYMKYCFEALKASRGTVITFSSHAGIRGTRGMAAYGSNKEAVRGLTRVAAKEWGQHGINVNAFIPAVDSHSMGPERYARLVKTIPLGRMADAEKDCGALAVFLATEPGKILTGMSFDVDGGMMLRA
jgi:NAD(P)-dependent dehydrogenase (short-subunit alcohol dehydrogenase family)